MIKQIVFDIGNVLTDFQWRLVLEKCNFSKTATETLAREVFLSPLWTEYDRGVMGDEAVTRAIRKNCTGYEKEFDILYGHFREFVAERKYSAPLIKELKREGYGVYILSNYGDTMYHCNAVHFAFLKEVNGAVFSYREKLLKPDSAIYDLFLNRFRLKAEETLFLDDLKANVEGARNRGMYSEVVNSLETILAALKMHQVDVSLRK